MSALKDNQHATDQKSSLGISPPLINSANPWATTREDLLALYNCPHTGAVTIRTSLLNAFPHDPQTHQYTFFDSATNSTSAKISGDGRSEVIEGETNSLNTLGYSPTALSEYLSILQDLVGTKQLKGPSIKPWIVSVTGTSADVAHCYERIAFHHRPSTLNLKMEVNLSCPNIPGKPPPAYDGAALKEYIDAISRTMKVVHAADVDPRTVQVGIKTPPYTYSAQFQSLISALEAASLSELGNPISFITATNTLGSCLVVDSAGQPALESSTGEGIGGMAGDALHPIALGNVKTIRRMLDESDCEDVRRIEIIGVGGVKDAAGYKRMRGVGASVVGVGTALGREGVDVFGKITAHLTAEDLV
ncbi:dihydroorotate dehydrogenase protein [Rutstroemia sp. NJR-2017a BVV2]|nr:dihydroorotate dehydrogenase protein [Rutstroemia sp. NJR-2017a BVV2]